MQIFSTFEISASGLTAERLRMDVIANNIANANTTRTAEGGPYRRQRVVFSPRAEKTDFFVPMPAMTKETSIANGVHVVGVVEDPTPPRMAYDPGHPDADARGYVAMPAINIVSEMVDMMTATRAYEANMTVMNSAKGMLMKTLDLLKG
jgi:flagellar basal-body rod protein FlgC